MKEHVKFLVLGGLCLWGCSNAENPPAQSSSVSSAGTGVAPAATIPAAMSGAGRGSSAPPVQGAAAISGSPASSSSASASAGTSAAAGQAATPAIAGVAATPSTMSAGSSAMAGSGGNGAVIEPTFSAVYTTVLLSMMCSSCHSPSSVFGSPDLSSMDKAYASLVGKDASTMNPPGQCTGMGKLVTPGNCETSLLYNKISEATPKCGRRMPLGSSTVPQASIDLVCAWIKAGAKQD